MKALKKPFHKLLHEQGNLHDRVNRLRFELGEVQKAIDLDPSNSTLRDDGASYIQAFNEAKIDEERFLRKKAKVEWLDVGDTNSAYFHKSIKSHNQRSRIDVIHTMDNLEVTGTSVPNVFVSHYEAFLDASSESTDLDTAGLFFKKVSDLSNSNMTRQVTNDEIKSAMFDIGDNKAPGPDGYTSAFFKQGWDVVGQECISKILTNRIIEGIKEVVSENQSAFVLGRRISDNILLTQELMHNYHRDRGPPRCALKVDIQKAYDTVDWRILGFILKCFGFHHTMITWIMACVTSPSFSISINGGIHGFFKGKRGLRQGDPLSPYLFTLVMEILTLILQRRMRLSDSFRYHKHCEDLQLINLCFADDLFLFARGEVESAKVIMESLDDFKQVSGLVLSIPKSTTYFCNVLNHVKIFILNIMPFSEGDLPVIYMGVPLISSRLLNKDCKILVEKARNRIGDWKNKSLSFAGRLQLCKSVISSMQVAKVAWDDICLPMREGGLGIRCLKIGNGLKSSLWYELWCAQSPLHQYITPRDIAREGHNLRMCVVDIISDDDCMRWRDGHGNVTEFSVKCAWEALRPRGLEIPWYSTVWFPHCIPRHKFYLWLLMRTSLKTQDKLRPWDVDPTTDLAVLRCSLCGVQMDSHEHIFFECGYSSKVWSLIRKLAGMENVPPILEDIVAWFHPMAAKRSFINVVGKLLFAATAYYIWLERNNRLFKNTRRSPEELRDLIMVVVRLKLVTFRFKNKPRVIERLSE
ncbi:protein LAZ1 [Tanacetum coccineum]